MTINNLCCDIENGETPAIQDQAFHDAIDLAKSKKCPEFQDFLDIYYSVLPWKKQQEKLALTLAMKYAKTKSDYFRLTKVNDYSIVCEANQKFLHAK